MDHNSWSIYGNYNSEVAQQMWISIDRCVNKTIDESEAEYYTLTADDEPENVVCASSEEIDDWLYDKYVLLYYNEVMFNNTGFHDDSIIYQSRLNWIKISNQINRLVPFSRVNIYAETQDFSLNLDDLTEKSYDFPFTWE